MCLIVQNKSLSTINSSMPNNFHDSSFYISFTECMGHQLFMTNDCKYNSLCTAVMHGQHTPLCHVCMYVYTCSAGIIDRGE